MDRSGARATGSRRLVSNNPKIQKVSRKRVKLYTTIHSTKAGAKVDNIKFVFFDIGYTLVNEDAVWEQRCYEQADESKVLGLTPEIIFNEIVQAAIQYLPQYKTVILT